MDGRLFCGPKPEIVAQVTLELLAGARLKRIGSVPAAPERHFLGWIYP